jgi:hypothetical protein
VSCAYLGFVCMRGFVHTACGCMYAHVHMEQRSVILGGKHIQKRLSLEASLDAAMDPFQRGRHVRYSNTHTCSAEWLLIGVR